MKPHILTVEQTLAVKVEELSDEEFDVHCARLFSLHGTHIEFAPTGTKISATKSQTQILMRHLKGLQKGQFD